VGRVGDDGDEDTVSSAARGVGEGESSTRAAAGVGDKTSDGVGVAAEIVAMALGDTAVVAVAGTVVLADVGAATVVSRETVAACRVRRYPPPVASATISAAPMI
jgi:hypothetical protein